MSKFIKFKEILNLKSTISLLSNLTNEPVQDGTIEDLIYQGYLNPILGSNHLLVGFRHEDAKKIDKGGRATPSVFSEIGIPYNGSGWIFSGVSFAPALSTAGEEFLFCRAGVEDGAESILENYSANELLSLDFAEFDDFGFLTEEVYKVAEAANKEDTYFPPSSKPNARIRIGPATEWIRFAEAIDGLATSYPIRYDYGVGRPQGNKNPALVNEPPSYRLALAALLEILKEPRQAGRNQSAVISEVLERYPDRRGLSKRSLESMFSSANKALTDQS